jgi:hypothetical protein
VAAFELIRFDWKNGSTIAEIDFVAGDPIPQRKDCLKASFFNYRMVVENVEYDYQNRVIIIEVDYHTRNR